MKKIKFLVLLLPLTFLIGCNFNASRYAHFEDSPSTNYYTNEILEKLSNNETFSLNVFDTNLYKYYEVSPDDFSILNNFLTSLDDESFSKEFSNKNKEKFRLIIDFQDEKYIIKVFDKETAVLSPWDGNYSEDIINMSNIPLHYNLYDFCNYIEHKKVEQN
ncbi:DUF4883 family protein [Clostridium sp.]|uniref:DUF4883 family protein n=1 Tax=Clostridium sp. TaxID=1506 RepID=UPI002FCB5EA6